MRAVRTIRQSVEFDAVRISVPLRYPEDEPEPRRLPLGFVRTDPGRPNRLMFTIDLDHLLIRNWPEPSALVILSEWAHSPLDLHVTVRDEGRYDLLHRAEVLATHEDYVPTFLGYDTDCLALLISSDGKVRPRDPVTPWPPDPMLVAAYFFADEP